MPSSKSLGWPPLSWSHERAARVPGADREHARLLLGVEVAMGLGQRHAGQRLGVGPEIDQLLVVVEDLDHPRVLPGELALEEAQGVVGAELVEQHPVRDVVCGPVTIGGAGGKGGVARLGALADDVLELLLGERTPGRHRDVELLEDLLVEVQLVGRGFERKGPGPDLSRGSRSGPERLAVRLDVLPANAGRQIGQPPGRHELGGVDVVVDDVGEAGAGREGGSQRREHVLLFVEGDGHRVAGVLGLEPALGLEEDDLLVVLDRPVAPTTAAPSPGRRTPPSATCTA